MGLEIANEEQLRQNLGAVGWDLTVEQVARLDAASAGDTVLRENLYGLELDQRCVNSFIQCAAAAFSGFQVPSLLALLLTSPAL